MSQKYFMLRAMIESEPPANTSKKAAGKTSGLWLFLNKALLWALPHPRSEQGWSEFLDSMMDVIDDTRGDISALTSLSMLSAFYGEDTKLDKAMQAKFQRESASDDVCYAPSRKAILTCGLLRTKTGRAFLRQNLQTAAEMPKSSLTPFVGYAYKALYEYVAQTPDEKKIVEAEFANTARRHLTWMVEWYKNFPTIDSGIYASAAINNVVKDGGTYLEKASEAQMFLSFRNTVASLAILARPHPDRLKELVPTTIQIAEKKDGVFAKQIASFWVSALGRSPEEGVCADEFRVLPRLSYEYLGIRRTSPRKDVCCTFKRAKQPLSRLEDIIDNPDLGRWPHIPEEERMALLWPRQKGFIAGWLIEDAVQTQAEQGTLNRPEGLGAHLDQICSDLTEYTSFSAGIYSAFAGTLDGSKDARQREKICDVFAQACDRALLDRRRVLASTMVRMTTISPVLLASKQVDSILRDAKKYMLASCQGRNVEHDISKFRHVLFTLHDLSAGDLAARAALADELVSFLSENPKKTKHILPVAVSVLGPWVNGYGYERGTGFVLADMRVHKHKPGENRIEPDAKTLKVSFGHFPEASKASERIRAAHGQSAPKSLSIR